MAVYSEETIHIPVGLGINKYSHPAHLQDGECVEIKNFIAMGDRLVTRKGFSGYEPDDTRETNNTYLVGIEGAYSRLPNVNQPSWPVAIYNSHGAAYAIRQFNRDDPSTNDGNGSVGEFSALTGFTGACIYLDRIYANLGTSINRLSSFNWSANSVTVTSVGSTQPAASRGLFVFRDRMWCWDDTKIYYTDVPVSPGAYPEVWDANANFLVIAAGTGLGKIKNIIPVGTKLFVFTTSGLYNVSIVGTPENWIVRLVDSRVSVNARSCCIEDRGLIYFIDSRGVWVTNQAEVREISIPISFLFDDPVDPDEFYIYKMVPFEDGMLICRQRIDVSGGNNRILPDAKVYFTKFDDIFWSEFTLTSGASGNLTFSDVLAGFAGMEIYDDWTKKSYVVFSYGVTSPTGDQTIELTRYQGSADGLEGIGDAYDYAEYVQGTVKTKVVRGEFLKTKRGKYGYINYSAEGNTTSALDMSYQWDTERVAGTPITVTADTIFNVEGLIKIQGPEYWRALQLTMIAQLTDDIDQFTIMGASLNNHTDRKEPDLSS